MKKKKQTQMFPGKTVQMQFNSPVSPMPMCGESRLSFSDWVLVRESAKAKPDGKKHQKKH